MSRSSISDFLESVILFSGTRASQPLLMEGLDDIFDCQKPFMLHVTQLYLVPNPSMSRQYQHRYLNMGMSRSSISNFLESAILFGGTRARRPFLMEGLDAIFDRQFIFE